MRFRSIGLFTALTVFGAVNCASAADLAVKAPVYKTPIASWTGAYAGIIGGYATGPSHSEPTGILALAGAYPIDFTVKGGFAGGQLGYNYQFANGAVLGLVGDIAWADLSGRGCAELGAGCSGLPRDSYAIGSVKWLATVRGKAGFAVNPQLLLYATGGAAFAGTRATDTFIDGTHDITAKATNSGWVVGAGGEYKLTHHVSFGFEYLYADFGNKSYAFDSSHLSGGWAGLPLTVDAHLKLNIVKASLNYHF